MSSKLKYLMEEMKRELDKKTIRRNVKISTLIKRYRPTASEREKSTIRTHLTPRIGHLTIAQLQGKEFCDSFLDLPKDSARKILNCFENIIRQHDHSFEVVEFFRKSPGEKKPKIPYRNLGKKFGREHILQYEDVLKVINGYVMEPYKLGSFVACFSALRLGNVFQTIERQSGKNVITTPGLRKSDVMRKEGRILVPRQTKTGKPVEIPIANELDRVFCQVNPWPLKSDGLIFPNVNGKNVSVQVGRAFKRAGYNFGSFHHFRHFAGCYLINKGVALEVVRDIMGHADFRSTLVYARNNWERLQEAVRKFNAK